MHYQFEWRPWIAFGGNEVDFLTGRKKGRGRVMARVLLEMKVIAADWIFCLTSQRLMLVGMSDLGIRTTFAVDALAVGWGVLDQRGPLVRKLFA